MRLRIRFGIKLKMTLAFSIVFILLSISFNLYCYHRIRALIIENDDKYLLDRASHIIDKIEVSPIIIPLPSGNTWIRVLYHSGDKRYQVFQSPGIIKRISTPTQTGVSDTLGMRVAYIVSNSEENPAELVMVSDGTELNKSLDYLLLLLFTCSAISVLVAGLIAYVLAFYLLRPVQRIINAAKVINASQLSNVIPVRETQDELQELTETINTMLLRIEASLKQQQNFFASASHELKTPLAIMRAQLELGLKNTSANPEIAKLMQSQLEEINRLQQVVQEFLVVSQLKSGALSVYKEPVDLPALILKAFNRLQGFSKEKGITTKIEFDEETANFNVMADQDKLWIVLINLVENAIKYGLPGKEIQCFIKTSDSAEDIEIMISNQISEEFTDTQLLKDAFYRQDIVGQGSGLGLWLCNELLIAQGGQLEITSRDYGFMAKIVLALSISDILKKRF